MAVGPATVKADRSLPNMSSAACGISICFRKSKQEKRPASRRSRP